MNHAVCRTARATPDLLNTAECLSFYLSEEEEKKKETKKYTLWCLVRTIELEPRLSATAEFFSGKVLLSPTYKNFALKTMLQISIYATFATNHFKSESFSSFSLEQNGKKEAPFLQQCSVALFPARLWLPVDA